MNSIDLFVVDLNTDILWLLTPGWPGSILITIVSAQRRILYQGVL